jgi:hypothetical protein
VNFQEFAEWIRKVEADFPVAAWSIVGIRVWPTIRLSLSSTTFGAGVRGHSLDAGWRRLGWNVGRGLVAWGRAYAGDRVSNQRPWEPAQAVFLTTSAGRRPLVDGKRYDVRSGPFVELLQHRDLNSLVWEMSPYGDYNVPRYTPSFLIQPHLVRLRVASQILPLGKDLIDLEGYSGFLDRVREEGLAFPHVELQRLRRDVLFLRLLRDTYVRWLRRAGPRLGFVANTSLPDQAFCLACRELGIVSVEVQHGVQGDLHPSYGPWFTVPPEGWPTRARVFWNWDEKSAATINRWARLAPDHHIAIVGGDPWREKAMGAGDASSRHTDRLIEQRMQVSGAERHILVTLTSTGDVIPREVLDAIRSAPPSWRFWFRLHPVGQVERMREAKRLLAPLGVDPSLVEFATETPLHPLLRRMDGHLSVGQSTVVAEAAVHGVPSVATSRGAAEAYWTEASAGLLLTGNTADEILAALDRLLSSGRRAASQEPPKAAAAMQRVLEGDLRHSGPPAMESVPSPA